MNTMKFRNLIVKSIILTSCISAFLFTLNSGQATAQSSSQAKQSQSISIFVQGSTYTFQSQPYMHRGTVFVPLREVSNALNAAVTWNSANKEITVIQPSQHIVLTLGKSKAIRNNKKLQLTAAPMMRNNQVYVSIRAVSQLLQAKVNWNSGAKEVDIIPAINLAMVKGSRQYYWLDRSNGKVYYASSSLSEPKLAGTMDIEIQGYSDLQLASSGSSDQLLLADSYGEPMINTKLYTALMINGSIAKQTVAHYWKRFVPNVTYLKDQPIMTDGKMLFILDQAGKVQKEYDLVKIVGLNEVYSVEGIGESYALVRPNLKGLLTLINLKTLETTQLYKQLNAQEQEYAEMNDVPYYGDQLVFEQEKDGVLYFSYSSIFDNQKHSLTYKLGE
ncbi:hypothetical protein D3C76_20400 [compost metagenome]